MDIKIVDISREYKFVNVALTFALLIIAIVPICLEIPGVLPAYIPTGLKFPECTVLKHTGQICKGDGLTRSVVAVYHGEWSLSSSYNPVGIIIVAVIFLELALRILPFAIKSIYLPWVDISQFVLTSFFLKYLFG